MFGVANASYAIGLNNKNKSDDFNMGLHVGGHWFYYGKWGLYLEYGGGNTTKVTGGVRIIMKL